MFVTPGEIAAGFGVVVEKSASRASSEVESILDQEWREAAV